MGSNGIGPTLTDAFPQPYGASCAPSNCYKLNSDIQHTWLVQSEAKIGVVLWFFSSMPNLARPPSFQLFCCRRRRPMRRRRTSLSPRGRHFHFARSLRRSVRDTWLSPSPPPKCKRKKWASLDCVSQCEKWKIIRGRQLAQKVKQETAWAEMVTARLRHLTGLQDFFLR